VGVINLAMQFAAERATDIHWSWPARAAMLVPCIAVVTVVSHIRPKMILTIHVAAAGHVIAMV